MNPKFYGTFDDAVQRLEGLVVRRSKGSPRGFFVEGVAQSAECRANMEIPQGIDFIGRSAFQNQTGLETVVLPESLTEIQPSALAWWISATAQSPTSAMSKKSVP